MTLSPGEHTVAINGVRLRYKVTGRGPVLVVQPPGWGVGVALYEQTFAPLETEFTVIYYDTRGSGGSERPQNPDNISVGAFVQDLEALRDYLGISSFALTGHSHGGYISLNYALKYQQRLSHLILNAAELGSEEYQADVARTVPQLAKKEKFAEAARAWDGYATVRSDEEFGTWLQKVLPLYFYDPDKGMSMVNQLKLGTLSLSAARATLDGSDRQFAVRNSLHKINVPTLVLVGSHDFITSPLQAQIIHESIKGSKLVVFEKSGHLPWFEEPDRFFSEVKQFLRQ